MHLNISQCLYLNICTPCLLRKRWKRIKNAMITFNKFELFVILFIFARIWKPWGIAQKWANLDFFLPNLIKSIKFESKIGLRTQLQHVVPALYPTLWRSSTAKCTCRPLVFAPIIWSTGLRVLDYTLPTPKLHPIGVLLALTAHNGVYSAKKLVIYIVFYSFWGSKLVKSCLRRGLDTPPYSSQRLPEVCFLSSSLS